MKSFMPNANKSQVFFSLSDMKKAKKYLCKRNKQPNKYLFSTKQNNKNL